MKVCMMRAQKQLASYIITVNFAAWKQLLRLLSSKPFQLQWLVTKFIG
jgi:hypothetical protein